MNTNRHILQRPGSAHGGYAIILITLIFLGISLVLVIGGAVPILAHYASVNGFVYSKQAFGVAESAADEALYRLKNGKPMPASLTVSLTTGSANVTLSTVNGNQRVSVAASRNSFARNLQIDLKYGTGISFHYGIQSGEGGFTLNNTSSITGNVFSNGTVTGSGNTIRGDVISAGSGGLISGIVATGTIYAHTLQNSSAGKDAYYYSAGTIDSYTSSHVTGTKHPGSSDQPTVPLPISDAQITQWENDTSLDGNIDCSSGTYSITSDTTSIGGVDIPCNLSIKNSTVTISGPVWVEGNIDIKGSTIDMAPSLGINNVAVIADNHSNPNGSGLITTDTSTVFYASGCPSACTPGAFIFLISQNKSAENGGSTNAISLGQSSSGVIAYASHGLVTIGQSVSLKEVTAYKIILQNTADVIYDTGLPNTLFSAGPGGGYDLIDWFEY